MNVALKILVSILCLNSCQNKTQDHSQKYCDPQPMPQYDYRATITEGEMTPFLDSVLRIEKRRTVFKPCRTVLFNAKFYSSSGEIISNEFISITPTGKRWEYQPEKQDEIEIKYDFSETDTTKTNQHKLNKGWINQGWTAKETTGIIENVEKVWTHPFRSNQYDFTQVAPFPQVELPLHIGKKWTDNNISLKEGFGDWSFMKVVSDFEVLEKTDVVTGHGTFKNCWKIKGVSDFPLGISELIYYFDEQYGFVKLLYTNYGGQKLDIEVVKITEQSGRQP